MKRIHSQPFKSWITDVQTEKPKGWFKRQPPHPHVLARTLIRYLNDWEKGTSAAEPAQVKNGFDRLRTKLHRDYSKKGEEVKAAVKQRWLGYVYRHPGLVPNRSPVEQLQQRLETHAGAWKQGQLHKKKLHLTAANLEMLRKVCVDYPIYIEFILKPHHQDIRERFFIFTVGQGNDPKLFIEYPEIAEQLIRVNLTTRTGHHPETLKVEKFVQDDGSIIEVPAIRCALNENGQEVFRYIPLNDPSKIVRFSDKFQMSVAEILKCFEKYDESFGDLIFTYKGIEAWVSRECRRPKEEAMLESGQFYNHLPVMEKITMEKAKKHCGENFDECAIALCATREFSRMHPIDLDKNHTLFKLYRKNDEGTVDVIYLGIFPTHFPTGYSQIVKFLGNTVPGKVKTDPNKYYHNRQFTQFALPVKREDFDWFVEEMRQMTEKGLKGQLPFQLFAYSCARYNQKLFNALRTRMGLPKENYFKLPIADTTPSGPMSYPHRISNLAPKWLKPFIIKGTLFLFFPWRGMSVQGRKLTLLWSKVFRHPQTPLYHPSRFFEHQRKEGRHLSGTSGPWWQAKARQVAS